MIAPTDLQAEQHYQGNLAVQRDIGFNTVVEVAWVGNYGRHYRQQKNLNNIPVAAYANVANLFNRTGKSADFIRRDWKGIGAVSYDTTDDIGLNYNSLQISPSAGSRRACRWVWPTRSPRASACAAGTS
jgi:hypothetical protein